MNHHDHARAAAGSALCQSCNQRFTADRLYDLKGNVPGGLKVMCAQCGFCFYQTATAKLEQQRDEARDGYRRLDASWNRIHNLAMDTIRAAFGNATVPQMVHRLRDLQAQRDAALERATSAEYHVTESVKYKVLEGRLTAATQRAEAADAQLQATTEDLMAVNDELRQRAEAAEQLVIEEKDAGRKCLDAWDEKRHDLNCRLLALQRRHSELRAAICDSNGAWTSVILGIRQAATGGIDPDFFKEWAIARLPRLEAALAGVPPSNKLPNQVTEHWLHTAWERVRAGEPEREVLADYGWAKAEPDGINPAAVDSAVQQIRDAQKVPAETMRMVFSEPS